MASSTRRQMDDLETTRRVLAEKFSPKNIKIYKYNSASIRIRIIDKMFRGMSIVDREEIVFPLIRLLPEDIQQQITVLLLLAPEETANSMMSREFDHPTRSSL